MLLGRYAILLRVPVQPAHPCAVVRPEMPLASTSGLTLPLDDPPKELRQRPTADSDSGDFNLGWRQGPVAAHPCSAPATQPRLSCLGARRMRLALPLDDPPKELRQRPTADSDSADFNLGSNRDPSRQK